MCIVCDALHGQSVNSGSHAGACSGFPEQQSGATLRRRSLWAAKGRGYGRHASDVMLCPPHCPPCLAAAGRAWFTVPPGMPSLETHGRFSALRHAETVLVVATAAARKNPASRGHTRSHPVTPGHIRGRGRPGKVKCITNVACYRMILKAMTSQRVLLKPATK